MIVATVWYRNIPDQILENVTKVNKVNEKTIKIAFVNDNNKEETTIVYLDDQTTVMIGTDL